MFKNPELLTDYGQGQRTPLTQTHAPSLSLTLALAAGLGGLSLTPVPAYATLGENTTSVQRDGVKLKASLRLTTTANIPTVHELTLPTGTVVREYLDAAGTVFAVSWRGPFQPDLEALLGGYFATYVTAPRSPGSNRSHLSIDDTRLVVRAGGHQRAFMGLAYVPELLPPSVTAADLQ